MSPHCAGLCSVCFTERVTRLSSTYYTVPSRVVENKGTNELTSDETHQKPLQLTLPSLLCPKNTPISRPSPSPLRPKRRRVSLCFEPSQPQRITSGLNTNFTLSPSYSFHNSSCHKYMLFEPIYIPWVLFCGPTKEPVFATANAGKYQERFMKKMLVNGPEG